MPTKPKLIRALSLTLVASCATAAEVGSGSPGVETTTDLPEDTEGATGTTAGSEALFADAELALVEVAIETGLGLRAAEAYRLMLQAEGHSEATNGRCPTRVYDDPTMKLAASACTTADGYYYNGRVVATNAITLRDLVGPPTWDASKPMRLDFHGFRADDPEGTVVVDGAFEQSSPDAPSFASHSTLTVSTDVASVTEDLASACTKKAHRRECAITEAWASVSDLGEFTLGGTVASAGGRFFGTLRLTGRDELVVDLDTVDYEGCHPYTIDGVPAGSICAWSGEEPLEVELAYGAACIEGGLHVEGYVDTVVDAMVLEALGPRMDVALPTDLADPIDQQPGWLWTGIADTSSVDWTCDDLSETSFRAIVWLDGRRACEAWGPAASEFPADCEEW